jgi:hypothetical protein
LALGLSGLVLLPALVLWPYRHAGFVSDDFFFGPGFALDSWRDIWLSPWPHPMGASKAWRPLVVLTYLVSAAWSDGRPESYHLFNYLVHGANAALLAILVRQLTRAWSAGFVAGLLFAVHPIVHEGVQWISGRTFPLAALFTLALCVWSAGAARRRAWVQHLAGVPLMLAALASYEFGIMAPVAALGVAYFAWGRDSADANANDSASVNASDIGRDHGCDRGRRGSVNWRALALFAAPYLALLLVYFAFRWLVLTSVSADIIVAARASSWAPIGPISYRVPRNVSFAALRLLAWPWFEREADISIGTSGVLTTIGVAWAAFAVLTNERLRAVGLWWLAWTAIFFLPIVAALAFSDRFGYLSAAGVAALIGTATLAFEPPRQARRRVAFTAMVVAVAVAWTIDLRGHGRDWAEAGRIGERLLAQLRQQEQQPSRPLALHFIDIPVRRGSAVLFLTYFPLAASRQFSEATRRQLSFHLYWPSTAASDAADAVLSRVRADTGEANVRVYRWNAADERLELLWRRDEP